eukprot:snap_masked-scaffold_11-processed-gene-4.13-mRNA-1 protein AED:1.00 eAED:1.00 QI:0/0/0/0/1/1/2/0/368
MSDAINRGIFGNLIGFGLLLLCSAGSTYFSKLLFNDPRIPQSSFLFVREHLELPVTLLLALLFLYLSIFIVFPWGYWGSFLSSIENIFRFWFNICLFLVGIFSLSRTAGASHAVVNDFSAFYKISEQTAAVISEAVAISGVLFVFFVSLALFGTIFSDGESNTSSVSETVVTLATRLNVLTASFVIAAAPVFRDIIAGLTIFAEGMVHSGDLIRLPGVLDDVGKVKRFKLRYMIIELKDKSVLYLPNRYLLAHPTENFSMSEKWMFQVRFHTQTEVLGERTILALFEKEVDGYLKEKEELILDETQVTVGVLPSNEVIVRVILKSYGWIENCKEKSELLIRLMRVNEEVLSGKIQDFYEPKNKKNKTG